VAAVGTAGGFNLAFLIGSEAIAREMANCLLGRGGLSGPLTLGSCLPATFDPAGTLVTAAPAGAVVPIAGPVPNPYPFWQWVPTPQSTLNPFTTASARASSATVYSDNHGEAVVGLMSGVPAAQAARLPNGTCPAPYTPVFGTVVNPPAGTPAVNCLLLPTTAPVAGVCPLGYAAAGGTCVLNFPALIQARTQFSAANPGCLNTSATGAPTTATGATAQVGPNGPGANQICVNSLGGVEFGAAANGGGAFFGTTSVAVIADYPYTRDHPAIGLPAGVTLNKVWQTGFTKSISHTGPIAGPAGTGTSTYTITIVANDICGAPITGEPVFVYAIANPGAVVLAPLGAGSVSLSPSNALVPLVGGTATLSLEVLNQGLSPNGLVIKAVFPVENVERFDVIVTPTAPGPQLTPVIYNQGYNMVGAPAGSNFGQAEVVYSYNPATGNYADVTASAAALSSADPACTGYWAYFASLTTVNIPASSKPGQTATCALQAGWNLVGNQFASPATITGTVDGGPWYWDTTTQQYKQVGSIPVGGAVWVFENAPTTLTLTAS